MAQAQRRQNLLFLVVLFAAGARAGSLTEKTTFFYSSILISQNDVDCDTQLITEVDSINACSVICYKINCYKFLFDHGNCTIVRRRDEDIPPDLIVLKKKDYYLVSVLLDFDDAQKHCEDHFVGGNLAMPQNQRDEDALNRLLEGTENEYRFLGFDDHRDTGVYTTAESNFKCLTAFTKWEANEPSHTYDENLNKYEECVAKRPGESWNDQQCNKLMKFICEGFTPITP